MTLQQPHTPSREALDRELRCYATPQLARPAGLEPEGADLAAELEPERSDVAGLIASTFGPFSYFISVRGAFPFNFRNSRG
jgi:hypothetical protein